MKKFKYVLLIDNNIWFECYDFRSLCAFVRSLLSHINNDIGTFISISCYLISNDKLCWSHSFKSLECFSVYD